MSNIKEKIIHSIETASHKIESITHKISDHFLNSRQKIEQYLAEKNIENTSEVRHGKESVNILANSDGTFITNNDTVLTRTLLNQVLFSQNGEKRLSQAMNKEPKQFLTKVEHPKQKVSSFKISKLFSNS